MPTVGKSEVDRFQTKWKQIAGWARSSGIAQPVFDQVWKQDYQRLSTAGDYTMSGAEAVAAITSAQRMSPVVPAPSHGPGDVLSNLGEDIKQLTTGLVGLAKKGITDVFHPTHAWHQIEALWHDPRVLINPIEALSPNDKEDFIDALGQSPLLSSVIPGIADVYAVRHQGWASLAERPVSSLLDLLPFGRGMSTIARAKVLAGLSEGERSTVADATRFSPTDTSAEAQSARVKAQQILGQSSFRIGTATSTGGLASLLSRTPQGTDALQAVDRWITRKSKGRAGFTSAELARLTASTAREANVKWEDILNRWQLDSFLARHDMKDPQEYESWKNWMLYSENPEGDLAQLPPEKAATWQRARQEFEHHTGELANRELAKHRLAIVEDPETGNMEVRSTTGTDGSIVKAHGAYKEAQVRANAEAGVLSNLLGRPIALDTALADRSVLGAFSRFVEPELGRFIAAGDPALRAKSLIAPEITGLPSRSRPRISPGTVALFGTKGTLASIVRDMHMAKFTEASRKIDSVIRRPGKGGRGGGTLFAKAIATNRDLDELRNRLTAMSLALKMYAGVGRYKGLRNRIDSMNRQHEKLVKGIRSHPEARYQPKMVSMVRGRLMEHLNGQELDARTVETATFAVVHQMWDDFPETMRELVSSGEMKHIYNSALVELNDLRTRGFRPVFVHSVRIDELEKRAIARPMTAPERISAPGAVKSRTLINTSAAYEPLIGLTAAARDVVQEEAAIEYFNRVRAAWEPSEQEIQSQAMEFHKATNKTPKAWLEDNYPAVKPTELFSMPHWVGGALPEGAFRLPRHVRDALTANLEAMHIPRSDLGKVFSRGTSLFRFSLLNFSPRYQAHIWGAGLTLQLFHTPESITKYPAGLGLLLRQSGPHLDQFLKTPLGAPFRRVADRLKALPEKYGVTHLPAAISHTAGEMGLEDALIPVKFATGNKLARIWMDFTSRHPLAEAGLRTAGVGVAGIAGVGAGLVAGPGIGAAVGSMAALGAIGGMRLANIGANLQRAAVYLAGVEKGGEEAGVQLAGRVFADMSSMTPWERQIIRYIMPFYGWTRHILLFSMRLPIDHPWRVSVLANLVNQEWEDWNSGIPKEFMYLFELGGMDPMGNAQLIDIRQMDPLRSLADTFTLSGFIGALNPAWQSLIGGGLGYDPMTGGPTELHPTLTIDQFYGSEKPNASPRLPALFGALAQYVPESSVIDHFARISSYTRWAAQNDHRAYANQLSNALNFPWIPQTANLYQVIAKQSERQWTVASSAASAAMGDTDPNGTAWRNLISSYSYVPYKGWLIQPFALRQWAFDQVVKAGAWNGTTALLPPSNIVPDIYGPRI